MPNVRLVENAGSTLVLCGVAAIAVVAFVWVGTANGLLIARVGAIAFGCGILVRIAAALLP